MTWQIIQGDCMDLLRGVSVVHAEPYHHIGYLDLPDNSVDAIVTDPPYGIHFMNRTWDSFGGWIGKRPRGGPTGPAQLAGTYNHSKNQLFQNQMREIFTEALRVLKPGGHIVSFGSPRTFHRLTCAIEDSGFVIRDCLMWLYGSGFPKSHNVAAAIDKAAGHPNRGQAIPTASSYQASDAGRENQLTSNPVGAYQPITEEAKTHSGKGTALKPAWEPIVLARKPLIGTVADNVLKYGTGALNIDRCRVESEKPTGWGGGGSALHDGGLSREGGESRPVDGRWPANLILDSESAQILDQQSGEIKSGDLTGQPRGENRIYGSAGATLGTPMYYQGGAGFASRFFYTSKASKSEREGGLDGAELKRVSDGRTTINDTAYQRDKTERRNLHPTVKPLDLMRWLVRLVTPSGGTVLDPFAGSGTTIMAARIEGFNGIGIEKDYSSCETARKRIAYAGEIAGNATKKDAEVMNKPTQLGLLK